ncbi:MAG: hypothetical protein WC120_06090, partial [Parcubacteria group bacterium]
MEARTTGRKVFQKFNEKDEEMKRFVLLLLFPLMCLFPQKASATLDNFDSYVTGPLAGNGYWTQPYAPT